MFALELKIIILTLVYFFGWFLFEKIFSRIWDAWQERRTEAKKFLPKNIVSIGVMTPLDQTARYIRGLKSPDWRIRRISCVQLGDKRGTAVIQALIETLRDPRDEVSIAAGEALTKIGDPMAIAALTAHVENLDQKMQESYERLKAA